MHRQRKRIAAKRRIVQPEAQAPGPAAQMSKPRKGAIVRMPLCIRQNEPPEATFVRPGMANLRGSRIVTPQPVAEATGYNRSSLRGCAFRRSKRRVQLLSMRFEQSGNS